MGNLFYSTTDKILYWVAGYTADGNTSSVEKMTDSLKENAIKFANVAGCNYQDVQTYYNDRPSQYQYMRVFYVKTDYIPESAFLINRGMFNHLSNS